MCANRVKKPRTQSQIKAKIADLKEELRAVKEAEKWICSKCKHFSFNVPVWGAITYCKGEIHDLQRHCTEFEPKTDNDG